MDTTHVTVGKVRREEEGRGKVNHVETRTDTLGRQQPATKPLQLIEQDPTDTIIKQILALFRQLDKDGRGKALDAIDRFFVSPFMTAD